MSPLVLERPGTWRLATIVAIVALAVFPALVLVSASLPTWAFATVDRQFGLALTTGTIVAAVAGLVGLVVGLPAGVMLGLFEFPGRRLFLAVLTIPVVIPTLLRAIGLSMFESAVPEQVGRSLPPILGGALAFSGFTVPLVLLAACAVTGGLSRNQIESVQLARSDAAAFLQALRAAASTAVTVALFAAILTLSDAGPPQLFAYPAPASEILTSFAAFYDFPLAASQTLALVAVVALLAMPVAISHVPSIASSLLARDLSRFTRMANTRVYWLGPVLLLPILLLTLFIPLAGLTMPLAFEFPWQRAWSEVARTWGPTFGYALGSAGIATVLATLLAVAVGRFKRLRGGTLIALVLLLGLPPAVSALGAVYMSASAPPALDFVFRSVFAVTTVLALRFLPVAALLMMRGFARTAPSWAETAAIHGVSFSTYVGRVLIPQLLPWLGLAVLLVALLSTAEIGIVLLLRPPGSDSLPVTIFSVMANAPEALVAMMSLLYVAGAACIVTLVWFGPGAITRWMQGSKFKRSP